MKRKTRFIAVAIVVFAAAGAVWFWKRDAEPPQAQASAPVAVDYQVGAEAADDRAIDFPSEPTERTLELPPSDATGSYKPGTD